MSRQDKIIEGIDQLLKDVFRHYNRGEWIDTATVAKEIIISAESQGCVLEKDYTIRYSSPVPAGTELTLIEPLVEEK